MTALAVLLLAATSASAQTPSTAVSRVMKKVDALLASEAGKDAREASDKDKAAEALSKDLKPLGWRAAVPLGIEARAKGRSPKAKLIAVEFLGLLSDPAAFAPLEEVLRDGEQPSVVRAAAAQSLPSQGLPGAEVSRALCGALTPGLDREVQDQILLALNGLGCPEPAMLVAAARAYGPRPDGRDLDSAKKAIEALGRSRGEASANALLGLVAYFPPRGDARAAAILALDSRRAEIASWRAVEAAPVVQEALRSENQRWDTMLPLVRLAAALGPRLNADLARLSRHLDAEVLVTAAEALAEQKDPAALPEFEKIVAGAMTDPRFSPQDGRPDPAALLARLEKAVAALKRAQTAR